MSQPFVPGNIDFITAPPMAPPTDNHQLHQPLVSSTSLTGPLQLTMLIKM